MRRVAILLSFVASSSIATGWAGTPADPAGHPANGSVFSDFNGDGFADLAIGVPYEGLGSIEGAGAVVVLYGLAGGLQATSPDDQFWNQDSQDVQDVAEGVDLFGWSLDAVDKQ